MSPPTVWTRKASDGCVGCCVTTPSAGGTVLLSSHLLHEIEVIADDLVVIGNGRIVAAGHQERAARGGRHLRPAPRDVAALARALDAAPGTPPSSRRRRRAHGRRHRPGRPGRPRRRRTPDRAAPRRRGRPRGDVPRAHRRQRSERTWRHDHHRNHHRHPRDRPREGRRAGDRARARSPSARVLGVELRKMFDTRSGLLADGRHRGRRACWPRRRGHPVRRRATSSPTTPSRAAIGVPMTDPAPDRRDPVGHQRVEPAQPG